MHCLHSAGLLILSVALIGCEQTPRRVQVEQRLEQERAALERMQQAQRMAEQRVRGVNDALNQAIDPTGRAAAPDSPQPVQSPEIERLMKLQTERTESLEKQLEQLSR